MPTTLPIPRPVRGTEWVLFNVCSRLDAREPWFGFESPQSRLAAPPGEARCDKPLLSATGGGQRHPNRRRPSECPYWRIDRALKDSR
jgi:hypothetical protein